MSLSSYSSRKRPIVLDSDDKSFAPSTRQRTEEKLDDLMHEVENLNDSLKDIVSLTKNSPFPVKPKSILRDTFKCTIFHVVPFRPPAIVIKCSKTILGCKVYVNGWYSGPDALTKSCPSFRTDCGYYNTILLCGLDGFLAEVKVVFDEESS